jgi:hypothetical protein
MLFCRGHAVGTSSEMAPRVRAVYHPPDIATVAIDADLSQQCQDMLQLSRRQGVIN